MSLQLLDLTSELAMFPTLDENQEAVSVAIKGFASVEIADREGEIASPLDFDIETFMNSPTLLENHKFLKDEFGNEVSSGKVTSAVPAYLADMGSDLEWAVKSIKTNEVVNTYPKDKVPNLKSGDRGLFVTAEVTNKMSVKRVLSGELGGLSWRGLTLSTKQGGLNRLRKIDLFEISLVHIPAVSQATFVVGKSVSDKSSWQSIEKDNVRVFKMRFEKSRFSNAELVSKYLETHNLQSQDISETNDHYFAVLQRPSLFQVEKSFAIPMGGVSVIAAPFKDEDMTSVAELVGHVTTHPVKRDSKMPDSANVEEKVVQKLYLLDDSLLAQFPKSKVALQKSADLEDGSKLEVYSFEYIPNEGLTSTAAPEAKTEVKTEDAAEKVDAPAKTETPVDNDVVASLKQQLQELRDMVASLKNPQPVAQEKSPEDEVAALKAQIEQATASAQESQKKLELVVSAFNKLVPEQPTRSESLKSVKHDTKNESKKIGDIFASVLPFEG